MNIAFLGPCNDTLYAHHKMMTSKSTFLRGTLPLWTLVKDILTVVIKGVVGVTHVL